jgi:DNA-binding NarL/FixJ family response regulator
MGTERPAIRVVLCDDVAEVRELVRDALEDVPGVAVVAAADNGQDCLRCVAEHEPDVVLLDLSMPGLDGLEALPHIVDRTPRTRVVVFSGFAASRMRERTLARGAHEYVEKGAPLEVLVDAVREAADGGRAS